MSSEKDVKKASLKPIEINVSDLKKKRTLAQEAEEQTANSLKAALDAYIDYSTISTIQNTANSMADMIIRINNSTGFQKMIDDITRQRLQIEKAFQSPAIDQMLINIARTATYQESILKNLMPTQEMLKSINNTIGINFKLGISGFLFDIKPLQKIGDTILKTKTIGTTKQVSISGKATIVRPDEKPSEELTQQDTSFEIPLETEAYRRAEHGIITYEQSAIFTMNARLNKIEADQQKMIALLEQNNQPSLDFNQAVRIIEKNDWKAIPAFITEITYKRISPPVLIVNDKTINFREESISQFISELFFSSKDIDFKRWSADELFNKWEDCEWFTASKDARDKFSKKLYQAVRYINDSVGKILVSQERLIIQPARNTYQVNKNFFKK